MEDFVATALSGAVGSSPVAIVLAWRLMVADKRIKQLEDSRDSRDSDEKKFLKGLLISDEE